MDWESSDMVRFDLGPLLQGQTRYPNLKVLITCLLLSVPCGTLVISRRALAREGDYEMMSVCACVRACVCACVS